MMITNVVMHLLKYLLFIKEHKRFGSECDAEKFTFKIIYFMQAMDFSREKRFQYRVFKNSSHPEPCFAQSYQ
jgi:hypothetical protein